MPTEVFSCPCGARPSSITSGSPSQMVSSSSASTHQTAPFESRPVEKSASEAAQLTMPARKSTPVTPLAEKRALR